MRGADRCCTGQPATPARVAVRSTMHSAGQVGATGPRCSAARRPGLDRVGDLPGKGSWRPGGRRGPADRVGAGPSVGPRRRASLLVCPLRLDPGARDPHARWVGPEPSTGLEAAVGREPSGPSGTRTRSPERRERRTVNSDSDHPGPATWHRTPTRRSVERLRRGARRRVVDVGCIRQTPGASEQP